MTTTNVRRTEIWKPGFTGPIDLEAVTLVREDGRAERGHRMSLNGLVAYLLGQEPNDYPRGMNITLTELSSRLNNNLGDLERQKLRPLARELAATYCWRCTHTRTDLLTALTFREMLPRVLRADGMVNETRALRDWRGDPAEATPALNAVLRRNAREGWDRSASTRCVREGWDRSASTRCVRAMLGVLGETARRRRFVVEPGEDPWEETGAVDSNFRVAMEAGRTMPEDRWAALMISQMRRLIAICPHVDRSRTPRQRRYYPWWS